MLAMAVLDAEAVPGAGLSASDLQQLRLCKTYCGSGALGLAPLRRAIRSAPDARWVRRISLHEVVLSGTLACLRYLVDDVQVETLDLQTGAYTPLELAVVWGKFEMLVFLLSRGADPRLGTDRSVANKARLRQQRLLQALHSSGDGAEFEGVTVTKSQIEPLVKEGARMVRLLEGVERYGDYKAWAAQNEFHPLVMRFSADKWSTEPYQQLGLLRSLVLAGRGALLPKEDRAAVLEQEAAKAAAKAREARSVLEVLKAEGFGADAAADIYKELRCETLGELRAARFTAEAIETKLEAYVRNKRIQEGEKRRLQKFLRDLDEQPLGLSGAPENKPKPAASKAKAKAKPKANAALLAAMKGAKTGGSASAAAKPTKAAVAFDGMDLLFHEELPELAFVTCAHFLFGPSKAS